MADHIGAEIRAWRESKGWTGVDLARKLDITSQRLSNWETGRGTPSITYIDRMQQLGFRSLSVPLRSPSVPALPSPGALRIFIDLLYDCDQDPDLRASARRELYRLFELPDN